MFFGVTRFSLFLPNSAAWYLSKDMIDDNAKVQEYKERLFNPDRLEERINVFFNITLPTLSKMKKNYTYYHILQISDEMPNRYKNIIKTYCHQYNFLILQEIDRYGNSKKSLEKIISEKLNGKKICFGLFSLDDDDVLAIDYFDKAAMYLHDSFKGHVISFGTGVTGLLVKKDNIRDPRICYEPKINIGLLRIGWVDVNGRICTPVLGNHKYVDKFSPTILDSREIMYFWTRHLNQDSSRSFDDKQHQMNIIATDLNKFEKISVDQSLKDKFPFLNFKTSEDYTKLIKYDMDNTLLNQGISLELGGVSGKISIEFDVELEKSSHIVDVNRALIASFQFLKNPEMVAGLSRSEDSEVGFFKYIAMNSQSNTASVQVYIPEQLLLKAICLRRWKMKGGVKIKNLVVKIEDV